jgi:hypothetical protein
MDCIDLEHDWDRWRASVNEVESLGSIKCRKFLDQLTTCC